MITGHIIKKPIFFLPVECTPRELDYKLNLARLICKEGWDVIIGNPPFIRDELKYKNYKGAFLEKGVNPDPEYYRKLKDITLYCLSDEGASNPPFSLDYPPAIEALKTTKYIFLWGKSQSEHLIKSCSDKVLNKKYNVIGYPGFEFSYTKFKNYHKSLKPKQLPSKYILINTNFASHNGFSFEEFLEACSCSPSTRESARKSYTKEKKEFEKFFENLKILLNTFTNETFLLRPHPAEKPAKYEEYFRQYSNVIVSNKGNVNQAIASAKLVLHNDCTSSLQSYLMEVPVISLAKINLATESNYNIDYLKDWSSSFGAFPNTIEGAVKIINYILKNNDFEPNLKNDIDKKAKNTMYNVFDSCGPATQKLLSIILPDLKIIQKNFTNYKLKNSRSPMLKIKMFIRSFLPLHYKVPKASRGSLVKFTVNDITARLKLLEEIVPTSCNYKVKKIFPNTYFISNSY